MSRECGACGALWPCPTRTAPTPEAVERVARAIMAHFDDPIGMKTKREWREMARAAIAAMRGEG